MTFPTLPEICRGKLWLTLSFHIPGYRTIHDAEGAILDWDQPKKEKCGGRMKSVSFAMVFAASCAALAATARADELADLKAEAEALSATIAQMAIKKDVVPAGYRLLTIGKADAIVVPGVDTDSAALANATTVAIRPTADLPASAKLQWNGMVRAGLVNRDTDVSSSVAGVTAPNSSKDIFARGELKLVASTDTAVGEVGSYYKLLGDFDGIDTADVIMSEAWGWWKLTDVITLGGGYNGSLGKIGHGGDSIMAIYSGGVDTAAGFSDSSQLRLSYADGPISAAVALEHGDETIGGITENELGVAAELRFTAPKYAAELAGFVHDDNWQVGIGATRTLFDVASLSAAAAIGYNGDGWWLAGATPMTNANAAGNADYWLVSLSARTYLSEVLSADIGYSHKVMDGENVAGTARLEQVADKFAAGLYFTPVMQFTAGVEGSYHMLDVTDVTNAETLKSNQLTADFVTVFRF